MLVTDRTRFLDIVTGFFRDFTLGEQSVSVTAELNQRSPENPAEQSFHIGKLHRGLSEEGSQRERNLLETD